MARPAMPTSGTNRYVYSVSYLRLWEGGCEERCMLVDDQREPVIDLDGWRRLEHAARSERCVRHTDEVRITAVSLLAVPTED